MGLPLQCTSWKQNIFPLVLLISDSRLVLSWHYNTYQPPLEGTWAKCERAHEWENEWMFEWVTFLDTQGALNLKQYKIYMTLFQDQYQINATHYMSINYNECISGIVSTMLDSALHRLLPSLLPWQPWSHYPYCCRRC